MSTLVRERLSATMGQGGSDQPDADAGSGIENYYRAKIAELEVETRTRARDLARLEAQRNNLNHSGTFAHRRRWFTLV